MPYIWLYYSNPINQAGSELSPERVSNWELNNCVYSRVLLLFSELIFDFLNKLILLCQT